MVSKRHPCSARSCSNRSACARREAVERSLGVAQDHVLALGHGSVLRIVRWRRLVEEAAGTGVVTAERGEYATTAGVRR